MGLIIGGPKVGKSSFCASIPDALILDLEGCGYDHIETNALVRCSDLASVKEALAFFFSEKNTEYKVLIVDHLRELTIRYAQNIAKEAGVKMLEQIGFGKGGAELKHDVYTLLKLIREKCSDDKKVIFVAHSTDRNGELRLDVDGKLDTMITGLVDYIGHIYRAGPENYINFCSQTGAEFGCRNKNLSSYNHLADWQQIVTEAEK